MTTTGAMLRQAFFLLLYLTPLAIAEQAYACTIFKLCQDGKVLVGNNEDWSDPDTKAWFLAPEKGKYGRVYFGFKNGVAQGGMNEKGLFFDWVSGFDSDWVADPNKRLYPGNVCEKMLEEYETVEQVLKMYETFDEPSFQRARIMWADKSGDSVIVGWENGKPLVDRSRGPWQLMGWGYSIAHPKLASLKEFSVEAAASILESCIQSGTYPTRYSNVYDLTEGIVHVYLFHERKPPVTLNLREEFSKGHHFYNVSSIAEQSNQPPLGDGKTLTRVEVDPQIYAAYVGQFEVRPGLILIISTEEKKLYGQLAGQPVAYELLPASRTRFFVTFVDSQVTFQPDSDGQVNQALVRLAGEETVAKRVK
jgi:hypothetical protein